MDKFMKVTGILGLISIVTMMSVVLYLGFHKTVVIADVSQTEMTAVSSKEDTFLEKEALLGTAMAVDLFQGKTGTIMIPIAPEVKAETISMENQYLNEELVLHIPGAGGSFYEQQSILESDSYIADAVFAESRDEIRIYLKMDNVYEYQSRVENGVLLLELQKPSEAFEKIVVLDSGKAEARNLREEAILDHILSALKRKLNMDKVRIYYLNAGDEKVDAITRAELANRVEADIYIGLGLSYDEENAETFGSYTLYNDTYFLPEFGNVELADTVEQEMVAAISGKACGLLSSEKGALPYLEIPSTIACPGYMTNETERTLLEKESYQEKIADGIYHAIIRSLGLKES